MNNRKWIGIDQSEFAIKITLDKLSKIQDDLFLSQSDFEFLSLDEKQLTTCLSPAYEQGN
jgi:hypothetical protein